MILGFCKNELWELESDTDVEIWTQHQILRGIKKYASEIIPWQGVMHRDMPMLLPIPHNRITNKVVHGIWYI